MQKFFKNLLKMSTQKVIVYTVAFAICVFLGTAIGANNTNGIDGTVISNNNISYTVPSANSATPVQPAAVNQIGASTDGVSVGLKNTPQDNTADNLRNFISVATASISGVPIINTNNTNTNPTNTTTTTTLAPTNTTQNATTPTADPPLPDQHAVEQEHNSSLSIFFVICVIMLGILLIHSMLQTGFQYLPESIVVVFLGALIGLLLKVMSGENASWKREEVFSPTGFFLVLLPPIIFESGYNLHKGNFFQNIGSILVFAIFGTTISALVIGAGCYLLGVAEVAYRLNFSESFAFGSLISAVDPVATVAIFHALDVDPILNMLVFGESILNDAISIVLTTSITQSANTPANSQATTGEEIFSALKTFCEMFFASAGIGVVFALISALLLKHVDLRKHPSLEFAMMLMFTYAPYVLAEGIHLSGIMAILFCGIVMSHYTHFNLSTVTQITMQQTMRTLSFIAETCVFAYLGLAIFSFKHQVELSFVIWSIVLCLLGRACNIFPLAFLVNKFREHKITNKMQFIMWFSGLRGAISYALSLHLDLPNDETRRVLITTTLIIVLFTTLFFGGSTMPLLKYLKPGKKRRTRSGRTANSSDVSRRGGTRTRKRTKSISLSKTREWGQAIDSEHLSELTEEEDVSFAQTRVGGFGRMDRKFFIPFFTRRFNSQELHECKSQMADLTNKWYQAIRISPLDSDESDEELGMSASTSQSSMSASRT
ncbi:PREDICTED: sodium/hydrogen exchanger 8 [Rhagoletis zephyria]|uniref:sodium/hydrogen exchanger 8 n=1 Tax=Rhagoletis zephyria TaxID=28612 RepID=UPI00081144AD|nr:PREDICTED: sodium/hydrogen exchanger 8 [Rhagoletis zephyria]